MAGTIGAIELVSLMVAAVAPPSPPSPPSRAVLLLEVAKSFAAGNAARLLPNVYLYDEETHAQLH